MCEFEPLSVLQAISLWLKVQYSERATPLLASPRWHFKPQIGLFPRKDCWDTDPWPSAGKLAARYLIQRQLGRGKAGTIGLAAF